MRIPKHLVWIAWLALATAGFSPGDQAEASEWPKEIVRPHATVTIYQPQVESFEENRLQARAAVSVVRGESAPEFGAIWLESRVDADRDERMAILREVKVPRVRFADASKSEQQQLSKLIEASIPASGLTISLDLLITDMEPTEDSEAEKQLKHDPPRIRYRDEPTILITLDGDPIYQEVEGSPGVERVVNTPFNLARSGGKLYLAAGNGLWYEASTPRGPWTPGASPPAAVRALEPEGAEGSSEAEASQQPAPDVLLVTEPTELIVSDGAPSWTPVEGMDLLYLDNTDSDVFLEVSTQRYYVLLSGRWYRGQAMGDQWQWEHVPNDELPKAFANIPEDSTNGHVLPMVAGTTQARDAVLDNTVPQTAAIKREGGAPLTVEYDGKPRFEAIEGIPAKYAVNTPGAVFEVGRHYWACDQGIWYEADAATGPWRVATEVPEVLYRIPPSNPHYNVTYVRVYDVTPEVVYVGYTPAYLSSYVYSGCVVYGTGWTYRPWYGRYYYPRVPTWGFHVSYNPWTGWGFGVSWSNGPFSLSLGFGGGGWFGPVGYRPWRRPYVGGGFRKTNINVDRSINVGDVDIDRSRRANLDRNVNNVYARGDNRERVANRPDRGSAVARPANRANDVLTDRSGNVYRRNEAAGWDQRQDRDWSQAKNLDRPAARDAARPASATGSGDRVRAASAPGSRPDHSAAPRPQLERDYQARARGSQRSSDFSRSRARSGGGHRGGGHRGGGRWR
jgi:hypothetical protein